MVWGLGWPESLLLRFGDFSSWDIRCIEREAPNAARRSGLMSTTSTSDCDTSREFRGVAIGIGRGYRHVLTEARSTPPAESISEAAIARAIRGNGNSAERMLPFAIARRVARIVAEEFHFEGRVGRAAQSSFDRPAALATSDVPA
jgi:hypothetical protein